MRILLIEDEKRLAEALVEGLEEMGFAVDHVAEGDKAVNRISLYRNEYDAIVLDLMLPGKDGLTICKEVRELGVTTPILVLTARNEIDNKVTLLNAGADDYIIKPFSFKELVARINALLRRPVTSAPSILQVRDIELDPATRKVTRGGTEIDCTLKEFALLEYLMRNQDRAINREEILDHVWDFAFDSFSNVVDVHVKNLRKKLDDRDNELISTVRGVGYRLNG